jgi:hypothetical protein
MEWFVSSEFLAVGVFEAGEPEKASLRSGKMVINGRVVVAGPLLPREYNECTEAKANERREKLM